MMRIICLGSLSILLIAAACGGGQTVEPHEETIDDPPTEPPEDDIAPGSADHELDALLDELWESYMMWYPTWATYEGDRRYDDRLTDVSWEAAEERMLVMEALAERARAIDVDALSPMARDTREMFLLDVSESRSSMEVCRDALWGVDGLGGPQVDFAMLPVFHSIRDEQDLEHLRLRYVMTEEVTDATVENLRMGLADGYVSTRVNIERAIEQTERLLATPIDDDPMLLIQPTDETAEYDTSGLRDAIEAHTRPALERYLAFLRDELLPSARAEVGVHALPTGQECYLVRMAGHIGPDYLPDELHQIGIQQLEWAHAGMLEVAAEMGVEVETAQEFIDWMRDNDEMYAETAEQIVELNTTAVESAEAAMADWFGRLPDTPVEVWELEAHRAPDAPAAYYYSAPEDGSRPGVYYVNTHEPSTRPLFNLEALAFHEAIPGHHLQIAIAQELPEVHQWRRNAGQTAFTEGWALYAEVLSDEMGLYTSPETRFGMYNYQAWRASRLVVDTGMHSMGWSRDEALEFLLENTSLPENEATNEIDRYIAWPGQALAYMVGRLAIEELRAEAEDAFGEDFDIRAFHDVVLGSGSVPLEILRTHVRDWIADETAE